MCPETRFEPVASRCSSDKRVFQLLLQLFHVVKEKIVIRITLDSLEFFFLMSHKDVCRMLILIDGTIKSLKTCSGCAGL